VSARDCRRSAGLVAHRRTMTESADARSSRPRPLGDAGGAARGRTLARGTGLTAAIAVGFVGATALAHGPEGAQLPNDPPAVAPAGEQARAAIAQIEASHAEAASIAKRSIDAARAALARAHGASLASDATAAGHLSKIALAWSDAARAVVRSAERERQAVEAEVRAARLDDDHERARAALETADARRRQLEDELARAESAVARARAASTEPERKRLGGRASAPEATPPKPTVKVPASSKKKGGSR
jgi:hypothetical protein